jgi:hypothetical protein
MQRVLPYEKFEALLAQQIEPGALVLANEASWLASRQAGAELVFNNLVRQCLPSYERYPVQTTHETSHITSYTLDSELLDEITAGGKPAYFLLDMWDWSWNAYYPHGKYAASLASLLQQLGAHATPTFISFTRDRGFQTLYRWNPPGGTRRAAARHCYVEGLPYWIGPAQTPIDGSPAKPISLASFPTPVARFRVTPGKTYWLHFEACVSDGHVVPAFDGQRLLRNLDARIAVPFDQVVTATTSEAALCLAAGTTSATAEVTNVWLKELTPERFADDSAYEQAPVAVRPASIRNQGSR